MIGEWKQEKEWANKSINKWKRHPWFGTTNPWFGKTNPWFGTTNPGFGTTDPGFGTTNPGFGTTNPGFGTTNHGFIARNFGCDIWMDEMKVFTVIYGWMRGRCSLWYMDGWEEGVHCDIWLDQRKVFTNDHWFLEKGRHEWEKLQHSYIFQNTRPPLRTWKCNF